MFAANTKTVMFIVGLVLFTSSALIVHSAPNTTTCVYENSQNEQYSKV